ncbi:cyclic nucleotide-binding domain-containing protein [Pseudomonas sp. RIT-PI-S]|uniref:Crp/Fnr family transcriptional regulator n=1 Tax=Pseudomonas sp. RIT-PI-S TaxID=3035295 RepID=UPI0021DB6945|nr:cyclic nucleotide-binding domain-containing protein [Pseudomonas sp. RIT-PI-S]
MYVVGEQSAYAEEWINRLQGIPAQLLDDTQPEGEALEVPAGTSLDAHLEAGRLYLIEAGLVHVSLNERSLFYLSEGDLLNLAPAPVGFNCQYQAAAPLRLVSYDRDNALAQVCANGRGALLADYLGGHAWLLAEAVTRLKQPEYRSASGFKHVAAGEVLIRQGDEPDHVFIIIDGHAEVFVDGLKVGDVAKEEIFGAMAVFTEEKRTATVIASTACTVMLIPKDQFLAMTQSNPRIAHSLIESMAKKINVLNRQLTSPGLDGQ